MCHIVGITDLNTTRIIYENAKCFKTTKHGT